MANLLRKKFVLLTIISSIIVVSGTVSNIFSHNTLYLILECMVRVINIFLELFNFYLLVNLTNRTAIPAIPAIPAISNTLIAELNMRTACLVSQREEFINLIKDLKLGRDLN